MADTPSNQGQPASTDTSGLEQLATATEAAKQLGLALIRLDGSVVPAREALALVSEKLAREYRLMPISVDATTKQLVLAVADPSLLASPAPSFLQELKQQGYTLQPKIAVPSEFETALGAYGAQMSDDRRQTIGDAPADQAPPATPNLTSGVSRLASSVAAPAAPPAATPPTPVASAPNPAPNTSEEIAAAPTSQESVASQPVAQTKATPAPESPTSDLRPPTSGPVPATVHSTQVSTVSLKGRIIPSAVLQRFPADVARKYQMVVFEVSPEEDAASVGAVNPGDKRVREILKFVQERNALAIRLYQISDKDFEQAISGYAATEDGQQKTEQKSQESSLPAMPRIALQAGVKSQEPKPTRARHPRIESGAGFESESLRPQAAPDSRSGGNSATTTAQILDTVSTAVKPVKNDEPVQSTVKGQLSKGEAPPVQRAAADKIRSVAQQPAPVAAPPAPPKPVIPVPTPLAAAPATAPGKIGGVTPVSAPTQYQQAVTRNSAATPQPNAQPLAALATSVTQPNAATPLGTTSVPLDEERNLDGMLGGVVSTPAQLEEVVKTGMVPRIIAAILSLAVTMEASDVHIESAREYVRVRLRVDGTLLEVIRVPTQLLAPLVSRIKIVSKLKIDESRVPQDGRFDVQVAGHEIDLRVSTLPTVHGEKVVMRLLDKSSALRKLEELGLVGTNLTRVRGAINDPYGIILVTGPTGSGKTSTLYAMLSELNTVGVNIVTLEDPVEYQVEGINQTQVKPAIGFSFADGLRSILRQDPNIVMVGEIRDKETAALATQAALTGHLVLSTLHTNDAAGAIPRMLDMGVEPFLLASSIKAVIGQRLIRKFKDPDASAGAGGATKPAALSPEVLAEVKSELDQGKAPEVIEAAGKQLQFQQPAGEDAYHGRLGIYEVLTISESISQLTLKKAAASAIADAALAEGMVTMRQDGIVKAANGLTSLDEVLQATAEK